MGKFQKNLQFNHSNVGKYKQKERPGILAGKPMPAQSKGSKGMGWVYQIAHNSG